MSEEEKKENKSTRAKEHKCISADVGEEKKEIHKAARIISRIALIAGVATFVSGLLVVPYAFCDALVSLPVRESDYHLIVQYLISSATKPAFAFFWLIAAISLNLSIAPLFIERDMRSRLLPLEFVLAGILLYYIVRHVLLHFILRLGLL
ncbi:MAG: hypothetical protein ACYS32_07805 [Planctomycetota bacterium]|jgi:hypothetical protein